MSGQSALKARQIWDAALDAVRSDKLVERKVRVDRDSLILVDHQLPLDSFDRVIIVGAGKATTGMARGLITSLNSILGPKEIVGWINVPENCVEPIELITVHPARPAGVNESTEQAVFGTERILDMLASAGPRDLCICLISGGGSALLTAPISGVTLAEKVQVTKLLSASGANISQLNTVRKQLSRVKGNRLTESFAGSQLFSLMISDVIGDPLDVIASGPTVPNTTSREDALRVLAMFDPKRKLVSDSVYRVLESPNQDADAHRNCKTRQAINLLIGNLQVAVNAADAKAVQLGCDASSDVATEMEGSAESIGDALADDLLSQCQSGREHSLTSGRCFCRISGGEPTVLLVDSALRGKGGRNQQLVLAALVRILQNDFPIDSLPDFCILSAGTDGEDGPTDAAGAFIDKQTILRTLELGLDPADYLRRNDAYAFFAQTGNLIVTGPTHTNVCDVRVLLVGD